MAKKPVDLFKGMYPGVVVVKTLGRYDLVVNLVASPFQKQASTFDRPYNLRLTAPEARQLAIELMDKAEKAAEYERHLNSP